MALQDDFVREFKALSEDPQPVVLTMTKVQAWQLMSQIQLALRHPNNVGPTARTVRGLAETIEKAVATTPALKQVARMGWDSRFDV